MMIFIFLFLFPVVITLLSVGIISMVGNYKFKQMEKTPICKGVCHDPNCPKITLHTCHKCEW
jgi:hypothetical protein